MRWLYRPFSKGFFLIPLQTRQDSTSWSHFRPTKIVALNTSSGRGLKQRIKQLIVRIATMTLSLSLSLFIYIFLPFVSRSFAAPKPRFGVFWHKPEITWNRFLWGDENKKSFRRHISGISISPLQTSPAFRNITNVEETRKVSFVRKDGDLVVKLAPQTFALMLLRSWTQEYCSGGLDPDGQGS